MRERSSKTNSQIVDFGIITIKEEEFEAVLDQFRAYDGQTKQCKISLNRDYILVKVPIAKTVTAEEYATVAITRCATQGNGVSQDVTRDIIADLSPSWILLVGIAGGLPTQEFSIGDVVLNVTVLDFSVEAVKQRQDSVVDTERTFAVQEHRPDYRVENYVTTLAGHRKDLGDWFNLTVSRGETREPLVTPDLSREPSKFYGGPDWEADARKSIEHYLKRSPREPKVLGVPIGSSDRLIKDSEILKIWRQVARHVRAVEMESAGVHIAARGRSASRQSVPVLSIRGISDIVGYVRDEAWTAYACHSAAAFAYAFVKSGYVSPKTETKIEEVEVLPVTTESHRRAAPSAPIATWGAAPDILQAIRLSLQSQDNSYVTVFDRSCAAAETAIQRARDANIAMGNARRLIADKIPDDYSKIANSPLIIISDISQAETASSHKLGAVLWDSGDEYFGEVGPAGALGVGVYKIYTLTQVFTPNEICHYRGEMWRGQYGQYGVWESSRSWEFVGEWIDGHPRLGCLTESGELESHDYDLYVGEFSMPYPQKWVADGLGVGLHYGTNDLMFGTFVNGKPSVITRTRLAR